jgi:hypothetical protein
LADLRNCRLSHTHSYTHARARARARHAHTYTQSAFFLPSSDSLFIPNLDVAVIVVVATSLSFQNLARISHAFVPISTLSLSLLYSPFLPVCLPSPRTRFLSLSLSLSLSLTCSLHYILLFTFFRFCLFLHYFPLSSAPPLPTTGNKPLRRTFTFEVLHYQIY